MYCTNWGIARDAAAMIATDSGAWVLRPERANSELLGAVVLSCNLKTVGTAYSTGVAPY